MGLRHIEMPRWHYNGPLHGALIHRGHTLVKVEYISSKKGAWHIPGPFWYYSVDGACTPMTELKESDEDSKIACMKAGVRAWKKKYRKLITTLLGAESALKGPFRLVYRPGSNR